MSALSDAGTPPPLTRSAAIAAYHEFPVATTAAELRTAAALLGEDPDRVVPPPRSTCCALATELLNDPLVDLALDPDQLAFLERVERGHVSLSASTLRRLLQMGGWVRGTEPEVPRIVGGSTPVPAHWGAPVPGNRLPRAPAA